MRIALGASMVMAAGLGLIPGAALANPVDLVAQAPQSVEGRIAPLPSPRETRFSPAFAARTDMLTTSTSADPFGDPSGAMRHRFASSMIDYYPLAHSGLRISAGVRMFQTTNFLRDAERATQGLLYNPHLLGSGAQARTGFAKKTPAVTVGYTTTFRKATFGFEAGSLLGRANANLPRAFEAVGYRMHGSLNPIANVVFGLSF